MHDPQYTTTDVYLAAFLSYRGATFLWCERVRPKKVEFHFTTGADMHDLLRLYWSGASTPIEPAVLFAHLHRLKCLSIDH